MPTTMASLTASTSSATPSAPSSTLQHGILNDTSLAAVTSSDNNRHVFFQDFNGSLRHTVFDQSANSWTNEADFVSTNSPPRNHTPLAAISINSGGLGEIHVFFVNTSNVLTAALYMLDTGLVGSRNPMNDSFAVATKSRSLSMTPMPLSQTGTSAEAVMTYEAPGGNITALRGYFSPGSSTTTQWLWQNVSDAVYSSFNGTGTSLSAPIGSTASYTPGPGLSFYFTFFNSEALSDIKASPLYLVNFKNWTGLCKSLHHFLCK